MEEFLDVGADVDVNAYAGADDDEVLVEEMVHLKHLEIVRYWHFQAVYFDLKKSKSALPALKNSQQSRSLMMLARPFHFYLKIYYPIHASTSQFDQLNVIKIFLLGNERRR